MKIKEGVFIKSVLALFLGALLFIQVSRERSIIFDLLFQFK
ncbi:MAG: hypothetical protein ACI83B_002208 [Sediminicola sp.]|jgi:hypothetical protein